MEQHISSECSVMTGRSKSKSTPVCSKSRCGKVLIAPIRCNVRTSFSFFHSIDFTFPPIQKCQKQFCLQHRFPADHGCTPATTPSGSKSIIGTNSLANLSSKASASGSRTVDAFKRAVASGASSSQPPATSSESKSDTSKPSTSSSYSNPFSKVDRYVTFHSYSPSNLSSLTSTSHLLLTTANMTSTLITDDSLSSKSKTGSMNPTSFIPRSVFTTA